MGSHVRRALAVVAIGVIAVLVAPAQLRGQVARASEHQHAPQLSAISSATTDAPAPAPRGRALDLTFAGVFLAAAFSIELLWHVIRRTSSYRRRDVRALGYGRLRGPPFASA